MLQLIATSMKPLREVVEVLSMLQGPGQLYGVLAAGERPLA